MRITMNYMDKPTITVKDASWVLSLSTSTVKRKIDQGVLKCVKRDNNREKILIYTDSIRRFLSEGGAV